MATLDEYITKQLELVELERTTEIEEEIKLQSAFSPQDLQKKGVCFVNLRITNMRTALRGRSILELEHGDFGQNPLPPNSFRTGDLVVVKAPKVSDESVRAVVVRVSEQVLTIAVDADVPDALVEAQTGIQVNKVANDVTYKRIRNGLVDLRKADKTPCARLISVLFGKADPEFSEVTAVAAQPSPVSSRVPEASAPKFNAAQEEAIKFALSASDLALIHGPPGTGKTTTVVEIIRRLLLRDPNVRILACGPSNISVDNLVEGLSKTGLKRLVRLGHPARILPSVLDFSLDARVDQSDESKIVRDVRNDVDSTLSAIRSERNRAKRREMYANLKDLRRELRQRENAVIRNILQQAQVTLCTLAKEAECWTAIQFCRRLILAGDHCQLAPTVKSDAAARKGLDKTLFDRALKHWGPRVMRMLSVQYRMNEVIMNWSSNAMYDAKLVAADSARARQLSQLPSVKSCEDSEIVLMWIDTAGCYMGESQTDEDDSRFNDGEASVVVAYVRLLVDQLKLPAGDIAVITPYSAQAHLLIKLLKSTYPQLEIGSVDGFQGREKEAIVLSLVRSNEDGEVGFLKDKRRLNVAVTRAKRHVCVIGDSETLSRDAFLAGLIDYFFEHGQVHSAEQYTS